MEVSGNNAWWCICCIVMAASVLKDFGVVCGMEVNYDRRSLIVGGQRKLLFSGSIHYPRSTQEMWPVLIGKGKEGGLDVIQTYVFWNLHEPKQGQYDFSGRYDLVRFIKEIQSQGMYVCLRIGPYIESEWSYGGLPFWLHDVPGIVFRSDNVPFKRYMQNFTAKIVNMMKEERLYVSQGGPIILSQIENEYENIEAAFQSKGYSYIRWVAKMAVQFQTGVPWIMCKQSDALDPVINTCNGMRCGETFGGPNSVNKPLLWTENWTSFFQVYGGNPYIRSARDIAFHVALFVAKGGSYINYYMYHGGTNFGRKGSEYVTTSYYDKAPLDEYGFVNQPKWGHLKDLHEAVKACSETLLGGVQTNVSLGESQQAYIFEEGAEGGCVAFLVNNDEKNETVIEFRNTFLELPPKSISIAQNCSVVIFNTANVTSAHNQRVVVLVSVLSPSYGWKQFRETVPTFLNTSMKSEALLEQMNTTKDESDYLWYTFRFEQNSSCLSTVIHVESRAHVVHLFVDGKHSGYAHGSHGLKAFTIDVPVLLTVGTHEISLLSVMVGLPDSGPFLESRVSGLTLVRIECGQAVYDHTNYIWGYQVGLVGEMMELYDIDSSKSEWDGGHEISVGQPLMWYTVGFGTPSGSGPVGVNLTSMGKGEAWVNGQSIGRYWPSFLAPSSLPSQSMYHLPRAFLKESGLNLLVLFEEVGGDPFGISINIVSVSPPS